MSKATTANVIAMGFDKTQFSQSTDGTFTTYLQEILDDISLRVSNLVTSSIYTAASSTGTDAEKLNFMRLKNAEMHLAAAVLWRRIENYERTNAAKSRVDAPESVSSRALRNAEMAEQEADSFLMQMGVSLTSETSTGIAVGVNESGMFESTQ